MARYPVEFVYDEDTGILTPVVEGVNVIRAVVATVDDELWFGVSRFNSTAGTPTAGHIGGDPVWTLDAGTTERVACSGVVLPAHWNTFDVEVWWTNGGAGSGDVAWQFSRRTNTDGVTLSGLTTSSIVTATAPATPLAEVTTIASGVDVPVSVIAVSRVGGDAGDTLANDAWLNAVRLVKAS